MTGETSINVQWDNEDRTGEASFLLADGVTALIGPSGAGKTTLARLIAGLDLPNAGHIEIDCQTVFDSAKTTNLKPESRYIGYVPQEPSLFPHMSVAANIRFSARCSPDQVGQYAQDAGISDLMPRMPHTLSGGEARRIAIVRALASGSKLLILDEPMNGLDPKRRKAMMAMIRKTARATGIPVLLITHQIEEMLNTADYAVLMDKGRLVTHGRMEDVMAAPETAKIMHYDDAGSVVEVLVTGRNEGVLETKLRNTLFYLPDENEPEGARLRLRILAQDVALALSPPPGISILNQLPCTVISASRRGSGQHVELAIEENGASLQCRITDKSFHELGIKPGMKLIALIKAVAVRELLTDTPG
ncbi:MAG: molybdenum ABC transporter ATP-binding protein [Alphaproteobacteria bacterium]|nr:molybdenum ABC transporter ATP-binding protein [Alphaproteobacteria bacterium]